MNDYKRVMDICPIPEGLEARLEQRVLERKPAKATAAIRPMSLAKKALLAAMLTALLTVSVGAAVLVKWGDVFTRRFGAAEDAPSAETLFQKVDVTSVCGDVTLRIPEALGDSQTIYYILEYRLPEGTDTELVRQAWENGEADVQMYLPAVEYYGTDTVSWEEYEEAMGHWWEKIEWRPQLEGSPWRTARNEAFYRSLPHPLETYDFVGGATAGRESVSFDPDSGTMRFLYFYNRDRDDLTAQPLTVLVYPPSVTVKEKTVALADHPALITFLPTHTAKAKIGVWKGGNSWVEISLSPFSVNVEYHGGEYIAPGDLAAALTLLGVDGEEIPLRSLSMGNSGSSGGGSVTYRAQFSEILDTERIAAVRFGENEIPLEETE